ncbi:glycosyltransferase family 9 protein [Chitinophaga rhizophila]|uniref:Glycosyltransferase family 9 protein n=1 Tax=Chitinophaga rhizophila TaxID=2866212 RepID=A0ABS7G5L3_9BACT|nr:glycosyltransferase family 9 protein [Chitinophaga rhizophila]MBW8682761.1 glycosyltransferase family 9 protein [Chitinophaga rhizophila]
MEKEWHACRRILCIRPDNIGDLLMSTPAIKALKQTFDCHITVLVSSMGAAVAPEIPEIDEVIVCDVPWVQTNGVTHPAQFTELADRLKKEAFDAAVIFTVYSQNPMPSILLAYLAEIPLRLAYCRENPYHLLTHWIPDEEPYTYIRHQVVRDLNLVARVGAVVKESRFSLQVREDLWPIVLHKLQLLGLQPDQPWAILHPEVSEQKRKYAMADWVKAGREIVAQGECQLLITGKCNEVEASAMRHEIGGHTFSAAGVFNLQELIVLIRHCSLLISVNTGTIHIASAVQTPVLVLYALTNPQHTPWNVTSEVLYFDVPESMQSKNEVVRYVYQSFARQELPLATPGRIAERALYMLERSCAISGSFQQPHTLP